MTAIYRRRLTCIHEFVGCGLTHQLWLSRYLAAIGERSSHPSTGNYVTDWKQLSCNDLTSNITGPRRSVQCGTDQTCDGHNWVLQWVLNTNESIEPSWKSKGKYCTFDISQNYRSMCTSWMYMGEWKYGFVHSLTSAQEWSRDQLLASAALPTRKGPTIPNEQGAR